MVASKIVKESVLCTEKASYTGQTSIFYNVKKALWEDKKWSIINQLEYSLTK